MKGVLLPGNKEVRVVDHADPKPGLGEVLIRIRASAICRSDMSLYYGNPIVGGEAAGKGLVIPGHEPAGDVVEVGLGVRGVQPGDRVAVYLGIGCGECSYCKSGYRYLCSQWRCLGFDVNGGDADYLVVPGENCLKLPDQLSYEAGAVMTDNIGTLYYTQKRLGVSGASTVAIFGLGPMGGAGVLIGKARGARIIAVDVLDARLELAQQLGADATINSIAFIGESRSTTLNPSDQIIRKLLHVIGGWHFPLGEWQEITRFVIDHNIPVTQTITHRFPLQDAPEAFRLFDQRVTEKAIFVWE